MIVVFRLIQHFLKFIYLHIRVGQKSFFFIILESSSYNIVLVNFDKLCAKYDCNLLRETASELSYKFQKFWQIFNKLLRCLKILLTLGKESFFIIQKALKTETKT